MSMKWHDKNRIEPTKRKEVTAKKARQSSIQENKDRNRCRRTVPLVAAERRQSCIQENKDRNTRHVAEHAIGATWPAEQYPGEQGSKPRRSQDTRARPPAEPVIQENKDRNLRLQSSTRCRWSPAERHPGEQGSKPPHARAPTQLIQENKDRNQCSSSRQMRSYPGEQGSKLAVAAIDALGAAGCIQENKDRNSSTAVARLAEPPSAASRRTRIETPVRSHCAAFTASPAERYPGEQGSKHRQRRPQRRRRRSPAERHPGEQGSKPR